MDNMKVTTSCIFLAILGFVSAESAIPNNQYLPVPSTPYDSPPISYGVRLKPRYIPYALPSPVVGQVFSRQPIGIINQNTQYEVPIRNDLAFGTPNINLQYGVRELNTEYGAPYLPPYTTDRRYERPARYNFKYDVQAPEYGNEFGHEEVRRGDVTQGRYYTLLPDGRRQVVEYIADSKGYRPKIWYEPVGEVNSGYPY